MKKTIILHFIICLLLVTGKSFATTTDESPESVFSSTNQDFIIIVDIVGIGSGNGPSLYSDVCGTNGANLTSGQFIPLPQVTSLMQTFNPVKLGFNSLASPTPNTYVDLHAFIDCKGRVVLADVNLWGSMRQNIIRDMSSGEIIEVRFYVQFSTTMVRIYEAPGGGGIIAVMTDAEGIQCTGSPYPNDCFSASIERSDDNSGLAIEETPVRLKVQPNPFSTSFESILNLTQDAEVKVALFDLMGREVRSMNFAGTKGVNQFSIDGDDLSAGMYVLSVQTGAERMVERMVKK